jgi:hypothetical protein
MFGVINMERKENKEKTTILEAIHGSIVFILFFPIIVVGFIFILVMILTEGKDKWGKCEYWRVCPMYHTDSLICNEDMGMYSGFNKPAGCYFAVQSRIKELKEQGKVLRKLR